MNSREWAFRSSHEMVFVYVTRYPDSTNRQIALSIDLDEKTVHRILRELEGKGYLVKVRIGRRTSYTINPKASESVPHRETHHD